MPLWLFFCFLVSSGSTTSQAVPDVVMANAGKQGMVDDGVMRRPHKGREEALKGNDRKVFLLPDVSRQQQLTTSQNGSHSNHLHHTLCQPRCF